MKKFLQKYKYTSLVAGALAIAVVSGAGGAFVHKKYIYPNISFKDWQESALDSNRMVDLWDQCHHKKGFYAAKKPCHPDKPYPSHYKKSSKLAGQLQAFASQDIVQLIINK